MNDIEGRSLTIDRIILLWIGRINISICFYLIFFYNKLPYNGNIDKILRSVDEKFFQSVFNFQINNWFFIYIVIGISILFVVLGQKKPVQSDEIRKARQIERERKSSEGNLKEKLSIAFSDSLNKALTPSKEASIAIRIAIPITIILSWPALLALLSGFVFMILTVAVYTTDVQSEKRWWNRGPKWWLLTKLFILIIPAGLIYITKISLLLLAIFVSLDFFISYI